VGHYWNTTVEDWFNSNPQLILEFPYHGVDFREEPDNGLPQGDAWGPVGIF